MELLSDAGIKRLLAGRITPFSGSLTSCDERGHGLLSHGLGSAGYDARLGLEFAEPRSGVLIDPKGDPEGQWRRFEVEPGGTVDLPPGCHLLGHTVERFDMPEDVVGYCFGKSTYARCGLIVNVTPLEPGWAGQVTLELHNAASRPIRIYPGEGICQFVFVQIERPSVSYRARRGKYMEQRGVTLPRV